MEYDIFGALALGVPRVLGSFLVCAILLAIGVKLYQWLTPYDELALIRQGHTSGGIAFLGSVIGMAIPMWAILASKVLIVDVIIWGIVAVLLQLIAFKIASLFAKGLREGIEGNNCAFAVMLLAIQVGVGLLNAGVMTG